MMQLNMTYWRISIFVGFIVSFFVSTVHAGDCTAIGENGSVCSIVCPVGQAALCIPGSGGNDPLCLCVGGGEVPQDNTSGLSHTQKSENIISDPPLIGVLSGSFGSKKHGNEVAIVDIKKSMENFLISYGPVAVTRTKTETIKYKECEPIRPEYIPKPGMPGPGHPGGGDCRTVTRKVTSKNTTKEILGVGPIDIVRITEPVFDPPVFTDLPDDITHSMALAQNCSDVVIPSASTAMSISVARSVNIGLTSTISHTRSTTTGFNYSIPNAGLTLSCSINISEQNSSATSKTDGTSETIAHSITAVLPSLKPHSAIAVELSSYKIQIDSSFTIKAIVDAPLSANDIGLKKLSDILNEEKRTFYVRGNLRTNNASEAEITYLNAPFDNTKCKGSLTVEAEYQPQLSDELIKIK
jgi:hypothetical protein